MGQQNEHYILYHGCACFTLLCFTSSVSYPRRVEKTQIKDCMSKKERLLKLQQERLLYTALENIVLFAEENHLTPTSSNSNVKIAKEIVEELVKQNEEQQEQLNNEIAFKLFFYGTLKRDGHNNHMVGTDATLIAQDTLPYKMVITESGLPYLTKVAGNVRGEVWEIEAEAFVEINRMEVGAGYIAETVTTDGGLSVIAYFIDPDYQNYILNRADIQESEDY